MPPRRLPQRTGVTSPKRIHNSDAGNEVVSNTTIRVSNTAIVNDGPIFSAPLATVNIPTNNTVLIRPDGHPIATPVGGPTIFETARHARLTQQITELPIIEIIEAMFKELMNSINLLTTLVNY